MTVQHNPMTPKNFLPEMAMKVKERRKLLRKTQDEAAKEIGMSKASYCDIEGQFIITPKMQHLIRKWMLRTEVQSRKASK